jgi:DNA-binding NarL/FixJ family response regulator
MLSLLALTAQTQRLEVQVLALTERERQILQLHAKGLSDYRIARELKMEMPNVKRSRKNAIKKIESAKTDLEFFNRLVSQQPDR